MTTPAANLQKTAASSNAIGWLVLPDQLFDPSHFPDVPIAQILCREDAGLVAHERFHKQRTIFYLAAMRSHVDALKTAHYKVTHQSLEQSQEPYEVHVVHWAKHHKLAVIHFFTIINKWLRVRIEAALQQANIAFVVHTSPMFLTTTPQFAQYLQKSKRPFMKTFYEQQRKRLQVLVHPDETPIGGRWSFDEDNRLPLPNNVLLPDVRAAKPNKHQRAARALCDALYGDHPGADSSIWLPVTRPLAQSWLEDFLQARLRQFGPYEDALSHRSDVLFHSVLTPFLNIGLLTPHEVLEKALEVAKKNDVPINSLEGFVRQIIGWREFIRGIYEAHSERQQNSNFFNHKRQLTDAWYVGKTGIPPLDDTLDKVQRLGWAHHIERLMVVGNLMLLLEIEPSAAHRWFMEMFIDSQEWVMGPNIYGMALFSDGGIFATKPYICGSNYYRKMGHYKRGDWCDGVDGLYWQFVQKHARFLRSNARMHFAVKTVQSMDAEKKNKIFTAADKVRNELSCW